MRSISSGGITHIASVAKNPRKIAGELRRPPGCCQGRKQKTARKKSRAVFGRSLACDLQKTLGAPKRPARGYNPRRNLEPLLVLFAGGKGFLFFLHARFFIVFTTPHFGQNPGHLNFFLKPAEGCFEILIVFDSNFWHDGFIPPF
jgi:hypothetical protein